MRQQLRNSLLFEERQTAIWFLWLFYIVFFGYEIIYYFLLPSLPWWTEVGLSFNGLTYLLYIILIGLLPVAMYLLKNDKPANIKYIYFFTYTCVNLVNDIWLYWGNDLSFSSGNIIEIVIVLFAPIFVNKRFFYIVSFGTMLKFIVLGIVLLDPVVLSPLLVVSVLTVVGYILLNRFLSYVDAVEQSYDKQLAGIVKGIITTLELKDPYTRGHSERVAEYAMMLAKATGKFDDDELKSFYYVCLLHDIGKIQIPDSILLKPGKLTEEEYDIIKEHPVVGTNAVQEVEGITENIGVIRHHHERWDGHGYPDGLGGVNIPILARITAIADAFDAMTTSRSYRSALPLNEAYNRIVNGKHTQFDPKLVDSFQMVYPDWKIYHQQYYTNQSEV